LVRFAEVIAKIKLFYFFRDTVYTTNTTASFASVMSFCGFNHQIWEFSGPVSDQAWIFLYKKKL